MQFWVEGGQSKTPEPGAPTSGERRMGIWGNPLGSQEVHHPPNPLTLGDK